MPLIPKHRQHVLETVLATHFCLKVVVKGVHTIDLHLAVSDHRLDHALLLQVLDTRPGERAVDLHPIHECRDGDEAVGLDIFVELIGGGLVKQDGVLCLVLDCKYVSIRL